MKISEKNGLQFYQFEKLSIVSGLLHFVTTRGGGCSDAPYDSLNMGLHVGDLPEKVLENRQRVCAAMGINMDDVVTCKQIHAGNVAVVSREFRGRGAYAQETAVVDTDAFILKEAGICAVVMLADCVPVVLYDTVNNVAGVAHSGWKGTICGVTTNTLLKMGEEFGTEPSNVIAGIGPSIGPSRYEVGPEVVEQALAAFPGTRVIRDLPDGKGLFDLWEANRYQLLKLGVLDSNIEIAGICTYDTSDVFFSDRRQRPTGRFMTAVMLR